VNKYRAIFAVPGARAFVLAGFIARAPIGMLSLGVVLLAVAHGRSFQEAGVLVGVFTVFQAAGTPFFSRWADRSGQSRVLPFLVAAETVGLAGLVWAIVAEQPFVVAGVLAGVTGLVSPHIGGFVRARWSAALHHDRERLSTAFSWETSLGQLVATLGPLLAVAITTASNAGVAIGACAFLLLSGTLWLSSQTTTQPPVQPAPVTTTRTHTRPRLWTARFALLLVPAFAVGAVFSSVELTVIAASDAWGMSSAAGALLAIFSAASFLSGLIVGSSTAPAAHPHRFLLLSATALAIVGTSLAMAPASIVPLLLLVGAAGGATAPVYIMVSALVEQRAPRHRLTEAFGFVTSALALGFAAGGTAAGAAIDALSATSGFLVTAGATAVIVSAALTSYLLAARRVFVVTGAEPAPALQQ
jgi:MFS family permease